MATRYSVTTKSEKGYQYEVGELVEFEKDGQTKRFLNLYMFPNTTFQVKEKTNNENL